MGGDSIFPRLNTEAPREQRSTHAAELEISVSAYTEIRDCLREAGWDRAFDGDMIDMSGVGLVPGEAGIQEDTPEKVGILAPTRQIADMLGRLLPGCKVFGPGDALAGHGFDLLLVIGGIPKKRKTIGSKAETAHMEQWWEHVKLKMRPGGRIVFAT